MEYEKIIHSLKRLRKMSKISSMELSKKIGKFYNYILKVEQGRFLLTQNNFIKILKTFELTTFQFFTVFENDISTKDLKMFYNMNYENKENFLNQFLTKM